MNELTEGARVRWLRYDDPSIWRIELVIMGVPVRVMAQNEDDPLLVVNDAAEQFVRVDDAAELKALADAIRARLACCG